MHQGVITKKRINSFFPVWVRQRELRLRLPIGHSDAFYKSLYSSISVCRSWGGGEMYKSGLFSLEFSPDGTLLVAGCEKNSFRLFDPLTRKLIRTVQNAHAGCVTHVKFLDSRTFATGGIDGTVSLWDTRNFKSRCRTLVGHSRRIGNIEFSRKNDLLITSGLAGIIYMWDMKNWNQRKAFNTFMPHHLQRMRLSPDETKMVISMANGHLSIVHELDLTTLAEDLDKFVQETFEFPPLHRANSTSGWHSSRLFSQKRRRNRVEIVSDFPNSGGFNVFWALEIHPQGCSVFSRSSVKASGPQWTCVHDIREKQPPVGGDAPHGWSGDECFPSPHQDDAGRAKRHRLHRISEERESECGDGGDTAHVGRASAGICMSYSKDSDHEMPDAAFSLNRGALRRGPVSPTDPARALSPPPAPSSVPPDPLEIPDHGSYRASFLVQDPSLSCLNPSVAQLNPRVNVRCPRLTHYIEEPYFNEWYMESLGVSADGRLVCSPLERGIRLLAFSSECSDQTVSWCGTKPRHLYELSTHTTHNDSVTCTKFSPRHCLLVSGGLDGKLAWYQPVL